jgi:hypothetical protein
MFAYFDFVTCMVKYKYLNTNLKLGINSLSTYGDQ